MPKFKFISDNHDYRHLNDKERYKKLYEEVGTVEANKIIKWREEWMKYFKPNPNSSILELGSHNGPNLIKYAKDGHYIDGVELSETLINTFNSFLSKETKDLQSRINLYHGWIEEFKISKKYDYVLVTEILEHVIDPIKILEVAQSHLKENGLVYISSPNTHWGNNTHVRGVPKSDLLQWLEKANLSAIEIWEEEGRTFCISRKKVNFKVYGLLRIRNEEEIINDTLNHLNRFCTGGIYIYDDCSEDNTYQICKDHPAVKQIIRGKFWDLNRARAEFENRASVLNEVKKVANENDWLIYIDADERLEYDWYKLYNYTNEIVGIKMRLFDYYITPEDISKKYFERKYIGPEYRDILIAFRNLPTLEYKYLDQREVILGVENKVLLDGFVKHYGKAISVEQWEKTCEYYSKHFPIYADKWENRKGKAIHQKYSDFANELICWNEKEEKGINLYEFIELNSRSNIEKLNILITNHHFLDYQGSELFTYTLAKYLKNLGHNVTLYTKYIDELKILFDKLHIEVVNDLELVKDKKFDIAHTHHNLLAIEVRYYFPKLPIVFMSHGIIPFLEQPPAFDIGISTYLAVSDEVKENLVSLGVNKEKIEVFYNKVDPLLFKEEKKINKIPQKALVISNKIDEKTEKIIKEACSELNISVDFIGKRFCKVSPLVVAKKINSSDIIFSLGRGIIEAMMCGRIPIIIDSNGGDGIVLPTNVKDYLKKNFSGRTRNRMFTVKELIEEIKKYDYRNGSILKEIANELFNFNSMDKIVEIYKNAILKNSEIQITNKDLQISEFITKANKETKHYENIMSQKKIFNNHLKNSEKFIEFGLLEPAKEMLNNLAEVDNKNLDVQNNLAVIAIMEEQYQEAQNLINNILSIDSNNEIALNNYQYLTETINNLNNY